MCCSRLSPRCAPHADLGEAAKQTPGNVNRFGGEALHNTENITALDKVLYTDVGRIYSSIRWRITVSHTMTVRQWLGTQSYEAQRAFGLRAITNVGSGVW